MVRNLSELTTLRIDVADVEVASISGWWGHVEAALLVRGDLDLSTDLNAARFEAVDAGARTAVLVLPSPVASPPRLDHARSRLVLVTQHGLWRLLPGDEAYVAVTNLTYQQAQTALSATARQPEHRHAARLRAEQVVRAFFEGIGWTVSVQWS